MQDPQPSYDCQNATKQWIAPDTLATVYRLWIKVGGSRALHRLVCAVKALGRLHTGVLSFVVLLAIPRCRCKVGAAPAVYRASPSHQRPRSAKATSIWRLTSFERWCLTRACQRPRSVDSIDNFYDLSFCNSVYFAKFIFLYKTSTCEKH